MPWTHSLFTRLALGLVALLFVIGVLYAVLNTLATQRFVAQLNQDLHRNLAQNLVADKNLVAQGKLNQQALKDTFTQYMVVNPSIEIYLLDLNGKLLAYSVDAKGVMRNRVKLAPIKAFLSGSEKYPLGDDPRSHDKQKPFSVTPVPSKSAAEGYLYVVLRGEQYDDLAAMAYQGFWVKTGLWAMILSLAIGLLAGLAIFYWLTKRLRKVAKNVEQFSAGDFTQWQSIQQKGAENAKQANVDEIGQLELVFTQMADRIQSQLSALSENDHQRRQFVAQISHDLRTPLASMLGYVESLRMNSGEFSQTQQAEFLNIVYQQGKRLSSMVDSLFELSSLEAKEIEPNIEPFIPAELLFDIRQKHLIRAQAQGLQIEIEHSPPPAFALGDISIFERVLDNLIENALVHAKKSSTIVIQVKDENRHSKISVINEGENIQDSALAHLFDPFYRAKSQSADKRHAGLGLAIAKRLMQSMSGTITAENGLNKVIFSVILPRAEA